MGLEAAAPKKQRWKRTQTIFTVTLKCKRELIRANIIIFVKNTRAGEKGKHGRLKVGGF